MGKAIKEGDLVTIKPRQSDGGRDGYEGVRKVIEVCRDGDIGVEVGASVVYFTEQRVQRH